MNDLGKVSVVTGATQGLGFALVEGLAKQLTRADIVYLTGRDGDRVARAVELVSDAQARLRGRVLDVGDGAAVKALAEEIHARHGGVDIVFSNAAARLMPGTPPGELVGPFVDTNNLGTTRMLRAFAPMLRPGGRLMGVAREFGSLRRLPAHLRERFDTDAMTLEEVDAAMIAWRDAVVEERAAEEGWPDWINVPSKVDQVAAVRVLARRRQAVDSRHRTLVAAVCPGLIDTPASRPWFADMSAAQTPAQAALALLRLALDPAVNPRHYGQLVQFGKIVPWR